MWARFPSGVLAPRLSQHIQERGGSAPSLSESESQKEECHPGEDIFNASFHNDIKITTITWDSPNTANIVPFGGYWDGGGGGAELKESPWREYCQCLFHKNNNHYLGVP